MTEKKKVLVIGPVYPYKGGIAHYTSLLSRNLSNYFDLAVISYKMQYPKILFKKEQKDYENRTFEIKDTKFWINTANIFNIISSAKKIRELKPDLIVVQWWHPYFAPCYQILFNHLKGIKKIFICHNVLPHERFFMDAFLVKGTLKKADGCIVHSSLDEADLIKILPDMPHAKNPHPTYNAFKIRNITRNEAREELKVEEKEKIMLFFGFVRKYKGLIHLINAMPDIIKNDGNIKLYVVGDFGNDKEEYISRIKELKLEKNIVVKDGYLPDNQVELYFAAADICICPYESATQSGIVQIAFGFEIPVLVTNVGGLPEVVTDNKTGYVVETKNPKAIADSINDFYLNNRFNEMSENVKAEKDRFSWDHMSQCIEEFMHE